MLSLGDESIDESSEPGIKIGALQPLVRVDVRVTQPAQRQINAPHARILAHIARNVRQLHADPEIRSACERVRRPHAHEQRHHDADRARHARRVGAQVGEVLVAAPLGIPGETLEQSSRNIDRNVKASHHVGESAIRRIVDGLTAIRTM